MRESELLAHIYSRSADLPVSFDGVVVGPGDDCALVRIGAEPLLLKVDQLVEGRHFTPQTPVDLVARKAIARALSDIAAMGGSPVCALAGATLPQAWSARADALFDAMATRARAWGCPLVGGDIATLGHTGEGPLVLSVTMVGRPHKVRGAVLRSGACPGDGIFVTGALGNSLDSGRHLTFEPRLHEAKWLCDTLGDRLHAMMDISDGLGVDAARLAAASGVRLELHATALPLHPDVPRHHFPDSPASTDSHPSQGKRAGQSPGLPHSALSDGEDYELLFTAAGDVPPLCPATGVPVTRIGRVAAGSGAVIDVDGNSVAVGALGWEHR